MDGNQKLTFLCKSGNNLDIYYDPIGSHAATHFNDTPNLKDLTFEALEATALQNESERIVHRFDKVIGVSDLIKTTADDVIIFAKRKNRDNYTRFVLDKSPQDSSDLTLVLYRNEDAYILYTAYIGILVPSFPSAPTATEESIPFWKEHALVWGKQEIQPGTERNDWPW